MVQNVVRGHINVFVSGKNGQSCTHAAAADCSE